MGFMLYMNKSSGGSGEREYGAKQQKQKYEQSDTNMLIDQGTYCNTCIPMMSLVEPNTFPLSSLISSGRRGRTERDGREERVVGDYRRQVMYVRTRAKTPLWEN